MQRSLWLRVRVLSVFVISACAPVPDPADEPGRPLADLTEPQTRRFQAGARLFDRVFSADEGLGPLFNENQCSACHTSPAAGGTGDQILLKATRFDEAAGCDLLAPDGGTNVRTQLTPHARTLGMAKPDAPAHASELGRFIPTFLFGLGLAEAVADTDIRARADPDDRDRDGISGRAGRDAHGRLGRFGRKADVATIEDFVRTALLLEMGITTGQAADAVPRATVVPAGADPAVDPEVADADVALLTEFVRLLAPVKRGEPRDSLTRTLAHAGEAVFERVGCTLCHTPVLVTSTAAPEPLARRRAALYSDLLLHDLGVELRSVCAPGATPNEHRTAILAGLRYRRQLLHDGRAHSVPAAIAAHGGEASAVRARYDRLPEGDRIALLTFLGIL